MVRRASVATVVAVMIIAPAINAAVLQVGVAQRVITPDPLLPVSGGMGEPSPVTGTRGDLSARAVVFQSGREKIAFVSLDVLGFPSVLCDRIHQQVQSVPANRILVSSSHTHSAPDCYAFPDG